MRRKNSGVTLIELLVVIMIVAILASIAIPAYRQYVIRANRSDGKAALLATAGALERCYTRFNSYSPDDGCDVTFPATSTEGHYQITAPTQDATSFELVATPQEGQADDGECGNLTINNVNQKGISTSEDAMRIRQCWSR